MRNKAKSALATAGYPVNETSAIALLADFAAQNSGLEFANYGDRKAYASEARSIAQDWRRFKTALNDAGGVGVTDADVIAIAPRAFSGRLEWISQDYLREKHGMNTDYTPRWDYCTGQYFPTEYRKAAATVLEYAAREKRGNRPARVQLPRSMAELKALNRENGGCWFNPGEMRFFGTRIETGIISDRYFITSEQREDNTPRNFTVRTFDEKGSVDTVGKFHAHPDLASAKEALAQHFAEAGKQ